MPTIMGIYGKMFILDLHNLQMLFMLWIRYTFSACLVPCTSLNDSMEDFLATVLPTAQAGTHGGHSGTVSSKSFLYPPNFVVLRKICVKDKSFPPKMYFLPQTLKPVLVLPKLCLQLRYFGLKAIWSRDVACRKLFFINHH